MPQQLKDKFEKDKAGLFNIFLLCGEDLDECTAYYERIQENNNTQRNAWQLVKATDLGKYYTEKQIPTIIERRTKQGWYEVDEEWHGQTSNRH
eukprot:12396632-Alexandrium_andersonii.AAC.1